MKQNDNLLIAIAAVWLDRIIPMEELLQRKSDLVCSTYLLSNSNYDWIGNPIPYEEFAFKRWKCFQKKFQTSYGIPQFLINHQRTFTGGVGRTNEHNEEWINKVLEEIKLTKKQNLSVINEKIEKKANDTDDNPTNTFSCCLQWIPTLQPENFSKLRYHLLLIANDYRNAIVDQTNVVYDMILLEEDYQEILDTYDGTGFLLDTEERKDNHTWNGFYLKSKPFVLPKVEGIYGWSLQLILEDPEDSSNYVYAWHFPIPEE